VLRQGHDHAQWGRGSIADGDCTCGDNSKQRQQQQQRPYVADETTQQLQQFKKRTEVTVIG
jgi:hypothetical protein